MATPVWLTRRCVCKLLAIVGVSLSIGCSEPSYPLPYEVRSRCDGLSGGDFYFPNGVFDSDDRDGAVLRQHYGNALAQLGEPSLSCGDRASDAYRLFRLQGFNPDALAIRISGNRNTRSVIAVDAANSTSGDKPVVKRMERELSQGEWDTLISAVNDLQLWFRPTRRPPRPNDWLTLDGDTWLLEARSSDGYHVIALDPINEPPEFLAAARLFFVLAGWQVPGELQTRATRPRD